MAFIRCKNPKNEKWPRYYLCENRREGGKVRQHVIAYLGYCPDLEAAIAQTEKELAEAREVLKRLSMPPIEADMFHPFRIYRAYFEKLPAEVRSTLKTWGEVYKYKLQQNALTDYREREEYMLRLVAELERRLASLQAARDYCSARQILISAPAGALRRYLDWEAERGATLSEAAKAIGEAFRSAHENRVNCVFGGTTQEGDYDGAGL